MANATVTSEDFDDDLLTCTICLEIFKTPKCLPCLHTFCASCLNTYILSTVDREKDKGLKCPVCRTPVSPESTAGKLDTWIHQFPGNHFFKSMMDRRSIQRDDKMCDSCQINNETKTALSYCTVCREAFCSSCEKCHKSFRVSAKHRIISIHDIAAVGSAFDDPLFINCDEHPEEVIKVYCVDHSKPLCTLCATLKHRKCNDITSIAKAASGIKQSSQALELLKHLIGISKYVDDAIQNRKENMSTFEEESAAVELDINKLKEEVIKHITSIADKVKQELETSKKQTILRLAEDETELSSMKGTIDNWITILNNCIKHGSEQQLLLEIDKIKSQKSKFEDEMDKSISGMKYIAVSLEPNQTVDDFHSEVQSFGNVRIDYSGIKSSLLSNSPKVDFQKGRINILRTIRLRGLVSGLFLEDELIFTQCNPPKVLKYEHDGSLQSELQLPNGPTDIASMDDHRAAVSSQSAPSLYIININDMTLLQTLNVNSRYFGLSYVNGEFICVYNKTLTWINASSGAVIDTKKTNGHSYFILASDRQDYICGDESYSVTRKLGGSNAFTYANHELSGPNGIDTDVDGNIYVCGGGSGNVHQLTKDGKLIRIIPAKTFRIKCPWVLRFLNNSSKFFITDRTMGKVTICKIV